MNCRSIRKLLYSFADGQLEVKDNCDVLDHVKMCPQCSRIVDEHVALRRSLGRKIAAIPVPSGMAARIHSSLLKTVPRSPFVPAWRRWSLVAASLAASFGLAAAVLAVWSTLQTGPGSYTLDRPGVVSRDGLAAHQVIERHQACIAAGANHHDAALPLSPASLALAMAQRFQDRLAVIVPDFSAFGFTLESAAYCGILDMPGKTGVHLVYSSSSSDKHLSFYCIPRWDQLDPCGKFRMVPVDALFDHIVEGKDGGKNTVVHWQRDDTTFIVAGPWNASLLMEMSDALRRSPR